MIVQIKQKKIVSSDREKVSTLIEVVNLIFIVSCVYLTIILLETVSRSEENHSNGISLIMRTILLTIS